jgi:hypothetical protein
MEPLDNVGPQGPPAGLLKRTVLGALAGGFVGILELWFYKFDIRHLIAAGLSGAVFGVLWGFVFPWAARDNARTCLAGAVIGAVGGIVWWIVVRPGNSVLLASGVGMCFGFLFFLCAGRADATTKA